MSNMKLVMPESEKADFRRWVYKQKAENVAECRKLIDGTLQNIVRWAMTAAPVDKGFLRSSIRSVRSHDELGGSIYTQRNYAAYQEFGTGKYALKNYHQYNRALVGLEDYAMTFKGKGIRKVNMYPHPYLFPAYALGVKQMMLKLKQMGFEPVK